MLYLPITANLYIDYSTRLSVDWHDDYPWKPKSADEHHHHPFLWSYLLMAPVLPLLLGVFSAPFHVRVYIHSCNHNDLGVFIVRLFIAHVFPSCNTKGCQWLQSTTNVRTSRQNWRGALHISTVISLLLNLNASVGKVCNIFVHEARAVSKWSLTF